MKKLPYIFCILFFCAFLSGCCHPIPQPRGPHEYRSYTASFNIFQFFQLKNQANNDIIVELYYHYAHDMLSLATEGALFEEKIEECGDTGYYGYWEHDQYRFFPSFNSNYPSFEIVSDVDWDAEHPAGTPINDKFDFYALSAYPFVQSGYEPYIPSGESDVIYDDIWHYYYDDDYEEEAEMAKNYFYEYDPMERYPVVKPFSEVTQNDFYMLGTGLSVVKTKFILRPRETPVRLGVHNITVTASIYGNFFYDKDKSVPLVF